MKIVIVSDIFGRTRALDEIAAELSLDGHEPVIVDPYSGRYRQFAHEDEAYLGFQQSGGLDRYRQIVLETVNHRREDLLLIGFSVGAAALWAISEDISSERSIAAVCFYGSQIRFYTQIDPRIKMELIFPQQEPHFDVGKLISRLSGKANVICHKSPYRHGFMNKKSVNFDPAAYDRYLGLLKLRLRR